MGSMIAGTSQMVITPPVGVDLCGFAGRPGPSQGVHDDLYAKGLFLADQSSEVLLLTADLIGLSEGDVAAIRDLLCQEIGLPADAVMVSCSHTHSGPCTHCIGGLGDWDEAYLALLVRKIASVGIMAAKHAQPALLGWAREPARVHINRRQHTDKGIKLGVNPEGLTLPWVDVLVVQTAPGHPLARWFCHAAHAVTLGSDNLLVSADWPGFAQATVQGAEPGATALYAQGCCGNLNSDPRGTFEIAQRQGWVIGGAVLKGAALAPRTGDVVLDHAAQVVDLPLQDPPSVEEAEQALAARREARDNAPADTTYQMRKTLDWYVRWHENLLAVTRDGVIGRTIPFEVAALRIGDAVVVGLPGEVFAEYAVNIAHRSPAERTIVTAYTNGNFGYVPTQAAFAEGGYEVDHAYYFYLPSMLTPDCEKLILDAAEAVVRSLFV
ncbi:MAG: hypothetical protein AB7W28_06790 [Armatimonadota bacterium]